MSGAHSNSRASNNSVRKLRKRLRSTDFSSVPLALNFLEAAKIVQNRRKSPPKILNIAKLTKLGPSEFLRAFEVLSRAKFIEVVEANPRATLRSLRDSSWHAENGLAEYNKNIEPDGPESPNVYWENYLQSRSHNSLSEAQKIKSPCPARTRIRVTDAGIKHLALWTPRQVRDPGGRPMT